MKLNESPSFYLRMKAVSDSSLAIGDDYDFWLKLAYVLRLFIYSSRLYNNVENSSKNNGVHIDGDIDGDIDGQIWQKLDTSILVYFLVPECSQLNFFIQSKIIAPAKNQNLSTVLD
eukprot:921828_1